MVGSEEPQTEVDWIDAESDAQEMRTELMRLKRRAARRPILLVILCLLGVSAVLYKVSKRQPIYQATIVMRVTEGVVVDEESPVVRQGLAHYLWSVALNTKRLMPIIEKYNLYPNRENFGPAYAIERLRDALAIDVTSNRFTQARDYGDALRSAGIRVHFTDLDPVLAFDVAQELSLALVAAEQERRANMAAKLNAIADDTVERVEDKLSGLKLELATAMAIKSRTAAQKAQSDVQQKRLIASIKDTQLLLENVSAERDQTMLAIAAEGKGQALRFEVMDVRPPVIAPKTSWVAYGLIGLFVFLCLLPICSIGIAALDSRLHHIEDLVRLGLPVVGHLPTFPSDSVGSMNERGRKAKDVA